MRNILYTLSALLLFTGCTKELTESGSWNDGKIRMNFVVPTIIEEQSGTRASLATNTTVRIVAFLAGGTTYVHEQIYYMSSDGKLKPCTVNSDGSFNAVDTENELALIPDKYDFYAITPALPLNEDKNTVTVPNGVDYASSVTSNITVNFDQTLTLTQLSRKSAKIALEIKNADDNTNMTSLKINPSGNGVTISALPASQSITLNADIPAATGATTFTIPASAFTLNGTTSTAITYLLPRLGTSRMSLSYDLTYTVSGTVESKTVSGSMGNTVLEKGKSYTFTLTMRKTGASLMIIDWIESNQDVVTGQELDYTDNGKPWFLIASGNALNPVDGTATMNWYIANGITEPNLNPAPQKICPDGWNIATQRNWCIAWIYNYGFLSPNFSMTYWTEKEYSLDNAFVSSMKSGFTGSSGYSKINHYAVRCVRLKASSGVKYPYIAEDGKTIVSRDGTGGCLPASLLNSDEKKRLNTNPLEMYEYDSPINKVSPKLEVATKDENNGAKISIVEWMKKGIGTDGSGCPAGWRMPTQRELLLIVIMKEQLNKVDPFNEDSYWCTAFSTSQPEHWWSANFESMTIGTGIKYAAWYVRCVRDVQ